MLNLKRFANIPTYREVTEKDRDKFKTFGFDPEELLQLKGMNYKELVGLMQFCGIRVFNDVPLCVMEEDEMRMAYLIWRSVKIKEKKADMLPEVRRKVKWLNLLRETVQTATSY